MLAGGLLVAAGLGWWVWQVTLLQPDERGVASGHGQFVLAAIGLLILLAGSVMKAFTLAPAPSLDDLTSLLALAMRNQWEQAAIDRRLLEPAPLPIRWRRSALPVAGPSAAATTARDGQARFDPLPGLTRVTNTRLREGTRSTLHAIYGGLASGRMLIIGGAGSGKSSAAILVLLDALRFRDQATNDEDRRNIPVPVMFTLHGWNPATASLADWLVTNLTQVPLLRGRDGARNARRLLTAGRIAVFLDGLDEILEALRPRVLRALSEQATFRLVLLTRSKELVDATRHRPLAGAVALELRRVTPAASIDYLLQPVVDPPPPNWQAIADELTSNPAGALAQALDTPLVVTLLRDAYHTAGPVNEILDTTRFPARQDIENHLLDEALSAAYSPRLGQPPPRYPLHVAQHALSYIARRLNQDGTRDLAWWDIQKWTFSGTRSLMVAITFGVVFGIWFGIALGFDFGITAGLVFGNAGGIVAGVTQAEPVRVRTAWWNRNLKGTGLTSGLAVGVAAGLAVGLFVDAGTGIGVGLTVGLALGLPVALWQTNFVDTSPHGPMKMWKQDVVASVTVGIVAGLTSGLALWLVVSAFDVHSGKLMFGAAGLALALALEAGFWFATAWSTLVSQTYLALRHRMPWRMMRFLEDARSRHVLRTVGPVYQFRHAKLQDRLAQTPAGPP